MYVDNIFTGWPILRFFFNVDRSPAFRITTHPRVHSLLLASYFPRTRNRAAQSWRGWDRKKIPEHPVWKVKTAQFTDLPNIRARNVCVLLPGARAHGPRPELAGSRLRPGYLHNYKYVRYQCQLRKEGCFQAALSHLDLTHQVLHLFLAPHLQPF